MKPTDTEIVIRTIETGRSIFAQYNDAQPRDAIDTLERLAITLNDPKFVAALDRLKGRQTLRLVE